MKDETFEANLTPDPIQLGLGSNDPGPFWRMFDGTRIYLECTQLRHCVAMLSRTATHTSYHRAFVTRVRIGMVLQHSIPEGTICQLLRGTDDPWQVFDLMWCREHMPTATTYCIEAGLLERGRFGLVYPGRQIMAPEYRRTF